ncbi:MAG: NADH-quinone oxidoreductase subunit A [Candidatus Delongbacteria bacterium]|nr:NADH-quinone oxidoreductase subunit A [Candidatus Delongbacteria bacterium]
MDFNHDFVAVAIMLGLAALISGAMVIIKGLLGPRSTNPSKELPFECGVEAVGSPRRGMHVKYYAVAILFIIFDIEIIFLYPWAVHFRQLGLFGFWQMLIFLAVLVVGLFYSVRKGVFKWQ